MRSCIDRRAGRASALKQTHSLWSRPCSRGHRQRRVCTHRALRLVASTPRCQTPHLLVTCRRDLKSLWCGKAKLALSAPAGCFEEAGKVNCLYWGAAGIIFDLRGSAGSGACGRIAARLTDRTVATALLRPRVWHGPARTLWLPPLKTQSSTHIRESRVSRFLPPKATHYTKRLNALLLIPSRLNGSRGSISDI